MDNFTKRIYYNHLFLLYQKLLTEKQQEYYIKHYLEDYSLQEIASSYDLSRNAIFDQLKKTIKILENYEAHLQLYQKKNHMLELIEKLKISYNKELLVKLETIIKDDIYGI